MRADVRSDFDWQRQFVPQIKRILANYLITEAPFEDDAKRNTDFMVLKAEVVRVACRIRRHDVTRSRTWPYQFTIRSKRRNGDTELAKLLSGWGQYIFYGIANQDDSGLCAWLLGDLNEFRLWHSRYLVKHEGRMPGTDEGNHDGSSRFRAYNIDDLPASFVVARVPYRREAA